MFSLCALMARLFVVMICFVGVEQIERAFDLCQGFLADMQVDHGGGNGAMAEQQLDFPNIIACLKEVSRKAVPIMPSSA